MAGRRVRRWLQQPPASGVRNAFLNRAVEGQRTRHGNFDGWLARVSFAVLLAKERFDLTRMAGARSTTKRQDKRQDKKGQDMAKGIVVIDPGHGGTTNVGGSDANHATSPSGVQEKAMTLTMGLLVRDALVAANAGGHQITVFMTRAKDENLGLSARATVARDKKADVFLSIHYNGFDGTARGVEAYVRPEAAGNVNLAEDAAFARRVQTRVLLAIKARDAATRDRGVKEMKLGVLVDGALGNTAASHPCRACLLEVEFIDVAAVDELLNTGPNAAIVRNEIAGAIRDAILEELA
jgi:N-acetylmuramoyl-L-alanine amidase